VAPTTSRRRNTAASDANSCAGDKHRTTTPTTPRPGARGRVVVGVVVVPRHGHRGHGGG
jgi:hypothetical protein